MNPWLFLLGAIVAEVLGTSLMRLPLSEAPMVGYPAMYALIIVSYYCLARAVEHISLGVAYALWEVLGLQLIALTGLLVFAEPLAPLQWLGVALMPLGIVLLKAGTRGPAATKASSAKARS